MADRGGDFSDEDLNARLVEGRTEAGIGGEVGGGGSWNGFEAFETIRGNEGWMGVCWGGLGGLALGNF